MCPMEPNSSTKLVHHSHTQRLHLVNGRVGNIEYNPILVTVTHSILWNKYGNDWLMKTPYRLQSECI